MTQAPTTDKHFAYLLHLVKDSLEGFYARITGTYINFKEQQHLFTPTIKPNIPLADDDIELQTNAGISIKENFKSDNKKFSIDCRQTELVGESIRGVEEFRTLLAPCRSKACSKRF